MIGIAARTARIVILGGIRHGRALDMAGAAVFAFMGWFASSAPLLVTSAAFALSAALNLTPRLIRGRLFTREG